MLVMAGGLYFVFGEHEPSVEERFRTDVQATISRAHINAASERWINLSEQPLHIAFHGTEQQFDANDEARLGAYTWRLLTAYNGHRFTLLSEESDESDDTIRLQYRMMARAEGMFQVRWLLRRHGEHWWLAEITLGR